jgi:glycosyltransferase involved in cell wall biosynthesis
MEKPKKISIVIPVYNNAGSISQLLSEIELEVKKHELIFNFEVILVDDYSKDQSVNTILDYQAKSKLNILILKLKMNHGQTFAIKTGFALATGNAVITLSADLQDRSSLISDFLIGYAEGNQIVIAVRKNREDGFIRKFTSYLAYSISRLRSPNLPAGGFDCYLISKGVVDEILCLKRNTQFIQGVITELGIPIKKINYVREARKHGKSQWTYSKKLFLIWSILLDNSRFSSISILKFTSFVFLFLITSLFVKLVLDIFNLNIYPYLLSNAVLFSIIYFYVGRKFQKNYKKHDFSISRNDHYDIV